MRKHYRFCSTSSNSSSSSDHDYLKSLNRRSANMAAASISRRPVGGHALHTNIASRDSVASAYSDDLGFALSPSYSHKAFDFGQSYSPPAVLSKDEISPLSENAPTTPQGLPASPTFGISATSDSPTQQTELWRRRSTKSDRNIGFSDLELSQSNGSTSSTANKQLPPPPEKSLPSLPKSVTGSTVRKAVATRQPSQPDFTPNDPMGNKHSKTKGSNLQNEPVSPLSPVPTQAPIARLPTPDYQSRDIHHPLDHVVSPLSPNTPPQDELSLPPKVPLKSPSRENFFQIPLTHKASRENLRCPGVQSNFSLPGGLRRIPSKENLLTNNAIEAQAPTAVNEKIPSPRVLSPTLSQTATQKFHTPLQSPLSQTNVISPFNLPPPAPPGTIFSAPPLNVTHFDCYQNHKYMRSSQNTLCSVACQVCEKKDTERRWCCSWCSLRCCDACMKILARSKKDLRTTLGVVAEELEELEKRILAEMPVDS